MVVGRFPVPPYYTADVVVKKIGDKAVAINSKGEQIAQSTDHTQVIQAAIENGNKIIILAGTYTNIDINVPNNKHIEGVGYNTVLKGRITLDSVTRVTLKKFRLDGEGNMDTGIFIKATTMTPFHLSLEDMYIENCEYGINASGGFWGSLVKRVYIKQPLKDGIVMPSSGCVQNIWLNVWVSRVPSGYYGYKGTLNNSFMEIAVDATNTGGNGVLLQNPDTFILIADIELLTDNDGNPVGNAIELGDDTPTWWGSGLIILFVKDVDTAIKLNAGALADHHVIDLLYRKSGTVNTLIDFGNKTVGCIRLLKYDINDSIINAPTGRIIYPNITGFKNSGVATLSGDGSTTDFLIGEHGLSPSIDDPSKVVVKVTPASPDAIAASPCVGYLSDENSDGVYESIRVKFASAPPSGTDNVKVVWEVEYIG